jgi:hypothetical protein
MVRVQIPERVPMPESRRRSAKKKGAGGGGARSTRFFHAAHEPSERETAMAWASRWGLMAMRMTR